MIKFEKIIEQIMDVILKGETESLNILRKQYEKCSISKIEKSSVGCYVEFKIKGDVIPLSKKDAYIEDVYLTCNNTEIEVGSILFIENGVISLLELYTYGDEEFPITFDTYQITYENGKRSFDTYLK